MSLRLRMFKLRPWDTHVHAVAATGPDGAPYAGPGVDLRNDQARAAFDAASPLFDLLESMEPGVRIRSLSLDLERPRLLATLEPTTPDADPRPRVVRLDPGWALEQALEASAEVRRFLETYVEDRLRRRAGSQDP